MGSQLELKLNQHPGSLSLNQLSLQDVTRAYGGRRTRWQWWGVDGSGGESMGAVVEVSGAKIELLKCRAHNLFKEQYHS
jgi:hypothetical protein